MRQSGSTAWQEVRSVLTWVVDATATGPVEGGVTEVRAPGRAEEHALCEDRAEDHNSHDGLREVHGLGWGEDDASIHGSKDDASAAAMQGSARLAALQQKPLCCLNSSMD